MNKSKMFLMMLTMVTVPSVQASGTNTLLLPLNQNMRQYQQFMPSHPNNANLKEFNSFADLDGHDMFSTTITGIFQGENMANADNNYLGGGKIYDEALDKAVENQFLGKKTSGTQYGLEQANNNLNDEFEEESQYSADHLFIQKQSRNRVSYEKQGLALNEDDENVVDVNDALINESPKTNLNIDKKRIWDICKVRQKYPKTNLNIIGNRIGKFKHKKAWKPKMTYAFSKSDLELEENQIQDLESKIEFESVNLPIDGCFWKNRNTQIIKELENGGLLEFISKVVNQLKRNQQVTLSHRDLHYVEISTLYSGGYHNPQVITTKKTYNTKESVANDQLRNPPEYYKLRKECQKFGGIRKFGEDVPKEKLKYFADTIESFHRDSPARRAGDIFRKKILENPLIDYNLSNRLDYLTTSLKSIARLVSLHYEISQPTTFFRINIAWLKKLVGIKKSKRRFTRDTFYLKKVIKNWKIVKSKMQFDDEDKQNLKYKVFKIHWGNNHDAVSLYIKELVKKIIDVTCEGFISKLNDSLRECFTDLFSTNLRSKDLASANSNIETLANTITNAFSFAWKLESLNVIPACLEYTSVLDSKKTGPVQNLGDFFKRRLQPAIEATLKALVTEYKNKINQEQQKDLVTDK